MDNSPKAPGSEPAATVRFRPLFWAFAFAGLLLTGFLIQANLSSRAEILLLREETEIARLEIKSLQQSIEAEHILAEHGASRGTFPANLSELKFFVLSAPVGTSSQAAGLAVWDAAKQEGRLIVTGMPPLATDRSFQLWMASPGRPSPQSTAVFTAPPAARGAPVAFHPVSAIEEPTALTVTVEPRDGSSQPEGTAVLQWP